MPAPKLATLVPLTQEVKSPVSATERLVSPWCPVGGLTLEIVPLPEPTENPPRMVATSPPVVRVTLYAPTAVEHGTETVTLACDASVTLKFVTVIPPPKEACLLYT